MGLVAVFALPLAQFLNYFLAAVRTAQVHYLVVVEYYFDEAAYLVELGIRRTAH